LGAKARVGESPYLMNQEIHSRAEGDVTARIEWGDCIAGN
jgi:hypothetical protein